MGGGEVADKNKKSSKGNKSVMQRTLLALLVVALVLVFAAAVANGRRRAAASPTGPAAAAGTELADVLAEGAGEDGISETNAAAILPGVATSTPVAPARSATNDVRVSPLTEVINIRSGPGTSFEVIGTLERGETAAVLARTQASDWFLIRKDNGLTGWVAANVIEFIEGEREAIGVAATIPAPTRMATEPPPPPPPPDDDPEPPQPPVTQQPSTPTAEPPVMKTPTVNPYP